MPEYVDYGSLMTPPAPFFSAGTKLYGFIAQADGEKLDRLCQKLFTETSGGRHDILAIGHRVMLTWGTIERVSSQIAPWDAMGAVAEPQVGIWIPAAFVDRRKSGAVVATRFCMTMPYIWVDNAMSLATGRELFGYPKSWGELTFPVDGEPVRRWGVRPFGLDYSADSIAGMSPELLLEMVEGDVLEGDGEDPWYDGLVDLARDVADRFFERSDEERIVPGLKLAADVAGDLLRRQFQQVFLKQVRCVDDGTRAALQQIVECTYEVKRLRARPRLREYSLFVRELDSHPVLSELGLESQSLNVGYEVEMDFTVGGGMVLWDAAADKSA